MMTSKILFDTNVLVYNQVKESSFHFQAALYHQKLMEGKIQAVVAAQNLLEFAVVMVNPKKIVKPLSESRVAKEMKKYQQCQFEMIYPNAETLFLLGNLIRKTKLANPKRFFDLFLAATMLANKVETILTANVGDFQIEGIRTIELKAS